MDGDPIGLSFVDQSRKFRLGNDQSGMQTDSDGRGPKRLFDPRLNRQSSLACQQCMSLLDMRRAKEGHYTVT
jgi:hypothetical protein